MIRLPYSVTKGYAVPKSTIFPLLPKTFRSLTSSFFLGNISSRNESVISAAFSFPRNFDSISLANVPLPMSIHSSKMRFFHKCSKRNAGLTDIFDRTIRDFNVYFTRHSGDTNIQHGLMQQKVFIFFGLGGFKCFTQRICKFSNERCSSFFISDFADICKFRPRRTVKIGFADII